MWHTYGSAENAERQRTGGKANDAADRVRP